MALRLGIIGTGDIFPAYLRNLLKAQRAGTLKLAKRWTPILNAFDEAGVDVRYEVHPGEDLCDGASHEMFLERVGQHPRADLATRRLRLGLAAERCYSGYPVIRVARAMVAAGEIGALRIVQVEYAQAGPAGCLGDIGTHAARDSAWTDLPTDLPTEPTSDPA